MPTQFGYKPSQFGPAKPRQPSTLGALPAFPSLASGSQYQPAAQPIQPFTAPRVAAPVDQPTPAPPAAARPPAAAAAGVAPPAIGYDYNTDPILNQIQALSTRQRGDAQSTALKLKKQTAIDFGDSGYARNVLQDEATALAAEQNPYSATAQLKQSYDTGSHNLDEQYNSNGHLFYSGARIKGQQDYANQYQGQLAGATGQEHGLLGQIDANQLAAAMAADQQDQQAQQAAYDRALQEALAYGINPGANTGPTAEAVPTDTNPPFAPAADMSPKISQPNLWSAGLANQIDTGRPDIWSSGLAQALGPPRNAYLTNRNKRG